MGKKHCSLVWYYYVFSVDKRHWHEFGIITCFLWIKGTGLSLVLLRVFYREKKLVGVWYYYVFFFLWIKGSVLILVLFRVFCG